VCVGLGLISDRVPALAPLTVPEAPPQGKAVTGPPRRAKSLLENLPAAGGDMSGSSWPGCGVSLK
jgi:hypothetical protein